MIYNMSQQEAVNLVRSGDVEKVRKIDGQFSLVPLTARTIRMARSIGRPVGISLQKDQLDRAGLLPNALMSFDYLRRKLDHQFHPSYTDGTCPLCDEN
jgi:asparagine synthase (glutamine-hydrolysing)